MAALTPGTTRYLATSPMGGTLPPRPLWAHSLPESPAVDLGPGGVGGVGNHRGRGAGLHLLVGLRVWRLLPRDHNPGVGARRHFCSLQTYRERTVMAQPLRPPRRKPCVARTARPATSTTRTPLLGTGLGHTEPATSCPA